MTPAVNQSTEAPSLLILGDLELDQDHEERLQPLVNRIEHLQKGADAEIIKKQLRRHDCLFACNVMLTPFISDLAGMTLVVLAETGVVHIDEHQAVKAGVNYTNIPGYSTEAVAQYVLRCIFESSRPWNKIFSPTTCLTKEEKIGRGIENARVGLVGYGLIGKRLAEELTVLGCQVQITTRRPFHCDNARWMPLEQLFAESEIVVVCCTYDARSRGLIGEKALSKMVADSRLISIAHRDVFDNAALFRLLERRQDIAAWLDFDWREDDARWLELANVNISPHLAFYTEQTLKKRVDCCIDHLDAFLKKNL